MAVYILEHQSMSTAPIAPEVARRRTFAIISHPDAGKTTLTEKLLDEIAAGKASEPAGDKPAPSG